jgi:hypothetical protein
MSTLRKTSRRASPLGKEPLPFKNPERRKAYLRDWKAQHPDRVAEHERTRSGGADGWAKAEHFLAVDGEAIGDSYFVLAASNETAVENPKGLSTAECFHFLLGLPVTTLWGFAFDYDTNQILSGLGQSSLAWLSHHNRTLYSHYRIMHIPGKILRITDKNTERTVTVYDAFSFIRSSFAQWLKDWKLASPADLAFIEQMKHDRPDFRAENTADIRRYNFLELKYLQAGVSELIRRVKETGYRPSVWYSPGSISAAVMKAHNVKDHMGPSPDFLEPIAKAAYFGGRFETRCIGQIPGPLFHFDINSAYPFALAGLPCLACGWWEYADHPDLADPFTLTLITWKRRTGADPTWGPFPIRIDNGSLRYPVRNDSPAWYWAHEVQAGAKLANVRVLGGWQYHPACEHEPFAFIPDFYRKRRELKARGDPVEYVYKLVLNSCYGKLAQRKRGGKHLPPFHSPLWAGAITARTRAMLLDGIAQEPAAVIQLATDGMTCFERLDLPLSETLGDWSLKELEQLFIVQSGIYFWQDTTGKPLQRSRGFHPSTMTYDTCREHWRTDPERPLTLANRRFIGYRSAIARGRPELWRTWSDYDVKISMTPEPRRERLGRHNGYMLSAPPDHADNLLLDFALPAPWKVEGLWATEQPDGPEGDKL